MSAISSQDESIATPTETASTEATPERGESRLDELLGRIQKLSDEATKGIVSPQLDDKPSESAAPHTEEAAPGGDQADDAGEDWFPPEPESFRAVGLTDTEVENLILKFLTAQAEASGRDLAEHVKLPFRLIDPLMQSMKDDQLVAHKAAAMMNDYIYTLTEVGRERGKKLAEHCTYHGAAPILLDDYINSVAEQTIADQHPTVQDLERAFSDLLIDPNMLRRLGPAINSGRGLFLFGAPGNGKTSIAERVTKAFGEFVWIPRALGIDGEIMRVYDPSMHEAAPLEASEGLLDERKIDQRWIRIKRPTIVVGGELTMDSLEVTLNKVTNVSEAPVQLKSNCGTLVIDDFGRQRMTTDELLNRWIVPLEKRYDFLNLSSGKKIQVPFDQLIVFSTNLEPRDLVDDAFLRRIPYKIEVIDPTEEAFRKLIGIMAKIFKMEVDQDAVDYLIETHYKAVDRPFRACQPRDLLLQIINNCHYHQQPAVMSKENFDFAAENYFAVM